MTADELAKLSLKEKRLRIAQVCGWRSWPYVVINGKRIDAETWVRPEYVASFNPDNPYGGCYAGHLPPDYLNDLNAMHKAEEVLTNEQAANYSELLRGFTIARFGAIHATAIQRANAFLQTIYID